MSQLYENVPLLMHSLLPSVSFPVTATTHTRPQQRLNFSFFNMGSADQEPQRLLCWTVYAYRKPGMDEEEYHRYLSEVHAPLVKNLLVKYGMVQWSMVKSSTGPCPPFDEQADITRRITRAPQSH